VGRTYSATSEALASSAKLVEFTLTAPNRTLYLALLASQVLYAQIVRNVSYMRGVSGVKESEIDKPGTVVVAKRSFSNGSAEVVESWNLCRWCEPEYQRLHTERY
jgi:hypothetical protein